MNWVRSWQTLRRPKINPFIRQLIEQSERLVEGAAALEIYLAEPSKAHVRQLQDIERAADAVRRGLIRQLQASFITPLDREDLFSLSRLLDDVLDRLYSTTRDMFLLHVQPNTHLQTMAALVSQCAAELHAAVQQIEAAPNRAAQHAVRVLALQNRMDAAYAAALTDLFSEQAIASMADVVQAFKLREIYGHLLGAVSSAEQSANLMNDILVKLH